MEEGSSRRRTGQKELKSNQRVNTYVEFCLTVVKYFKGFLTVVHCRQSCSCAVGIMQTWLHQLSTQTKYLGFTVGDFCSIQPYNRKYSLYPPSLLPEQSSRDIGLKVQTVLTTYC